MVKSLFASIPGLGRRAAFVASAQPKLDVTRVMKFLPSSASQDADGASLVGGDCLDRAEQAVEDLTEQFETWMSSDLDRLVSAWQLAQHPGAPSELYRNVFVAAHNIKGVANSYGYPAIARLCNSLSNLLSDTCPGENGALINLHVEACRAAFRSLGNDAGAQSIADAVCDALETRVSARRNAS